MNRFFAVLCFNSLQTGKHIQSEEAEEAEVERLIRFNSLQTGKHIQSISSRRKGSKSRVSIPFKRESISKASLIDFGTIKIKKVSIPFKRESISKD